METQYSRRKIEGDEFFVTFAGVSRVGFTWTGGFVDGIVRWSFVGNRREGAVDLAVSCLNLGPEEIAVVHVKLVDRRRSPPTAQIPRYGLTSPGRPCVLKLSVAGLQAQGLILQDSLTFSLSGSRVQRPSQSQSTLSLDLVRLLDSGEGTDVTFHVGDEDFPAHRAVVQARSPALAAEVLSTSEEHVRICGAIEPKIFGGFLKFLYTDQLPKVEEIVGTGSSKEDALLVNQGLFTVAEKFQVERMKALLEEKMVGELNVSTAAATLAFAEEHGCRKLQTDCCRLIVSRGWLHEVIQSEAFAHLKSGDCYPGAAVGSLLFEAGRALKRPRTSGPN